jgi:8-amino-7-oxononanoate synthase
MNVSWITAELDALSAAGIRRERRVVTPLSEGRCRLDGRTLVDVSSNDYLGLAGDERLIAAATRALQEAGVGARASALVSGRSEWHARLEERLARFEGTESAVLFPTGFAANLGTIAAVAGRGDVVFCDRLNHASLIDGCRLSGAKFQVYRHDALDRLETALKRAAAARRRWIVTDAVFSMDGNVAPLVELCDIADRHDAGLIVDEAHATGVFGERGRGVTELCGVESRVTIRIGTLSKAVGCLGGFVADSRALCELLWNTARPQMFSTALPPAICAAAIAAIDVIVAEPWRRRRVMELADRLRAGLRGSGHAIPPQCVAPIVPVILGDPQKTMQVAERLCDRGFLVAGIRPPTVPRGSSRLRISLSASHSEGDVDALVQAVGLVMRGVVEKWRNGVME